MTSACGVVEQQPRHGSTLFATPAYGKKNSRSSGERSGRRWAGK